MNKCNHNPVRENVLPDMGSFPAQWACHDCSTIVPITWLPQIGGSLPIDIAIKALEEISDAQTAPSYAKKDGLPFEATPESQQVAREALREMSQFTI